MEAVDAVVSWGEAGPWGVLAVFVLMIGLGLLIPRWTHTQRMGDREKHIALLTRMIDKRDEQFDKLVEQNRIIISLLEDFKRQSKASP